MSAPLFLHAPDVECQGDGLPALALAAALEQIATQARTYHANGGRDHIAKVDWLHPSGEIVRVVVEPAP